MPKCNKLIDYVKRMLKIKSFIILVCLTASMMLSLATKAEPWLNTNDQYLRACIDTLAQAGIIKSPVNTYPLMWKGIEADLERAMEQDYPKQYSAAFQCVKRALRYAKEDRVGLRLSATNDDSQYHSFGEVFRQKGNLNLYKSFVGEHFAFKSSVNFHEEQDTGNVHPRSYEGSYLAGVVANWVVSVDQVPQWWGPGKDSALALSNNAIAFPALRFTRHSSEAFESPWLSWIGPWTMTTYFGEQENSNHMPGINLWGMRVDWRPLDSLEVGFTRTSQWGGQGRPQGLGAWVDLFLGNDNIATDEEPDAISREDEPGNQLAGMDFTLYLNSLINFPASVYLEVIGEDEAGGMPSHTIHLIGAEYQHVTEQANHSFYFEISDTMALCGDNSDISNCAYQHHLYPEGYRRYGRSMGSTYDNDAKTSVLGYIYANPEWQAFAKLRMLNLNRDNQFGGNTVAPLARKEISAQVGLRYPVFGGKINAQMMVRDVTEGADTELENFVLSLSWELHY